VSFRVTTRHNFVRSLIFLCLFLCSWAVSAKKDKLEENVEFDAKTIIARSAFKTDDLNTAEEFYNEVERNASGELKAEALYYNAYFKNQNKKYNAGYYISEN